MKSDEYIQFEKLMNDVRKVTIPNGKLCRGEGFYCILLDLCDFDMGDPWCRLYGNSLGLSADFVPIRCEKCIAESAGRL